MTTTATDRQKSSRDNNQLAESGERKISLLVVEDDENISSAISEYFSRAGYDVKTVEDGLMGVKNGSRGSTGRGCTGSNVAEDGWVGGLPRASGESELLTDSNAHRKR